MAKDRSGNYQTDVKGFREIKAKRFEIASFILDLGTIFKTKSTV